LLKEAAINSFKLWTTLGKPQSGVEFDNMKRDKLRYKLAIRSKEAANSNNYSNSINDALSNKDIDGFWKTWRSKFG